jgi:phosphoglycolate phosphatase-like HAD superfamily hydrolase
VVFFDFDGTLTATPGEKVLRQAHKSAELHERAPLLAPRLAALRDAGILVGIISKSTEFTIRSALQVAGLSEFFTGPIVGKAVGLEGKIGFIEDLTLSGSLPPLSSEETSLSHILIVDDDVRELDRARTKGVQTFPAPAEGGLQDDDFDEIFAGLGIYFARAETQQEEHGSSKESLVGGHSASTTYATTTNPGA